jgi:hypothetical protein
VTGLLYALAGLGALCVLCVIGAALAFSGYAATKAVERAISRAIDRRALVRETEAELRRRCAG